MVEAAHITEDQELGSGYHFQSDLLLKHELADTFQIPFIAQETWGRGKRHVHFQEEDSHRSWKRRKMGRGGTAGSRGGAWLLEEWGKWEARWPCRRLQSLCVFPKWSWFSLKKRRMAVLLGMTLTQWT